VTDSYGLTLETEIMMPDDTIPDNELFFTRKRCGAKFLEKKPMYDLCGDACSADPRDENGTCTFSWPKTDHYMRKNSPDAACRCNPHKYRYGKCEKPLFFCGGCPDLGDGEGTCHWTWPFYGHKFGKAGFRCKYPLTDEEEEDEDEEDDEDEENDDEEDEDEEDAEDEDEEDAEDEDNDDEENEEDAEDEDAEDEDNDDEENDRTTKTRTTKRTTKMKIMKMKITKTGKTKMRRQMSQMLSTSFS